MRQLLHIAVPAALLLVLLPQSTKSLRCVPCGGKDRCPSESPICIYGLVTDICECCMVCGKGEGEICGGLWNMRGKCGDGLVCVKPQSYPEQAAYPEGTCRSHPTKRSLIVEDELEGDNATTTTTASATSLSTPPPPPTSTESDPGQTLDLLNALTYSQWVRRRLRN